MKRRFGREIALLTLPVLIFGGLALWKTRGGSMAQLQGAPSDIYSGKPRLEIGEIKPLEMTPWDVAQGFVWGIDAQTWQGGQSPVAPGVRRAASESGSGRMDVVYRRGSRWIKAKSPDGWSSARRGADKDTEFGDFSVKRDSQIKVRLNGVPRDAEEVRLRGRFTYRNFYQGGGCRGVAPGPGWTIHKTGVCYLVTQSKPFDIPIVKAKGAWPNPNVSRETALEFVDAKFLVYSQLEDFILQVRRKDGSAWTNQMYVTAQNVRLLDADKKPLELFDTRNKTKTEINGFGSYGQEQFSPQREKSDLFVPVVSMGSVEPLSGWSSVKFPLTLRAEVSDGTCWPLKIDTKVERVQMEKKDFGAAK